MFLVGVHRPTWVGRGGGRGGKSEGKVPGSGRTSVCGLAGNPFGGFKPEPLVQKYPFGLCCRCLL